MSEFLVYKFSSSDKPLTRDERQEVSSWSSRSRVNAHSATFTYSYSDFPKSVKKVVRDYFDVMLHFSSWGTKRVMFKFPRGLLDEKEIVRFDISADHDYTAEIEVHRSPSHIMLNLEWSPEDHGGYWAEEDDYDIGDLTSIRDAILNGDYSALYLFWLKLKDTSAEYDGSDDDDEFDYELDEDEKNYVFERSTPNVPPQLQHINGSLQAFIEMFEIDKDLVLAAQSAAKRVQVFEHKKDYPKLIKQLSEQEKEDYLLKLLNGQPRLELELKKHLDELNTDQSTPVNRISFEEIKASQNRERQVRLEKERLASKIAHRKRMEKLMQDEHHLWKSVTFNLDRKTGKSYDLAVETLKDLKELAIYKNELNIFKVKMNKIKEDYSRSTSLKHRFSKAGLLLL